MLELGLGLGLMIRVDLGLVFRLVLGLWLRLWLGLVLCVRDVLALGLMLG